MKFYRAVLVQKGLLKLFVRASEASDLLRITGNCIFVYISLNKENPCTLSSTNYQPRQHDISTMYYFISNLFHFNILLKNYLIIKFPWINCHYFQSITKRLCKSSLVLYAIGPRAYQDIPSTSMWSMSSCYFEMAIWMWS